MTIREDLPRTDSYCLFEWKHEHVSDDGLIFDSVYEILTYEPWNKARLLSFILYKINLFYLRKEFFLLGAIKTEHLCGIIYNAAKDGFVTSKSVDEFL